MECQFESLYFSEKGYVVRCKDCSHYQLGFFSFMLTLDEADFKILCNMVYTKCCEDDYLFEENARSFILPTPYQGVQLALTRREIMEFNHMLEQAEDEIKALTMINLFNP